MKKRPSKKNRSGTGFTMVEVIVALAILSTSLIAIFSALRTCSMAAYHSRMLTKAVLLAEELLTETKLNGNTAFEIRNGQRDLYHWQIQIAPTPVESLGSISVKVIWQEQQRPQEYQLLSLTEMKTALEGK
ncbi:prepilin-type N-terminal cleavage/methylation domain-containing protein [Planctomycetota bacterium]